MVLCVSSAVCTYFCKNFACADRQTYFFFSVQLGLGSTISEFTPRQIRGLLSRKVVQAACSYHHSFMLCSDGSLYSCGRNDSGQLGHGDFVDKKTPQCLNNAPANISSLSCGQFHSVCSTSSGVAYACGKNDYGQLGIENSPTVKLFTPIGVHNDVEFVKQVCCGYYHTLLLSNTGVVAGFGRNDYGQVNLLFFIAQFSFLCVLMFVFNQHRLQYSCAYLYIC